MRSEIACLGCGHATLRLTQSVRFWCDDGAAPPARPVFLPDGLRDCFVIDRAMHASTGRNGFVHTSVDGPWQDRRPDQAIPGVAPGRRGTCGRTFAFAQSPPPPSAASAAPHRLQRQRRAAHHLAADAGQPAGAVGRRGRTQFDHLGLVVQRDRAIGAPAGPYRSQNANDAGNGLARVVASDPFEGPVDTGSLAPGVPASSGGGVRAPRLPPS